MQDSEALPSITLPRHPQVPSHRMRIGSQWGSHRGFYGENTLTVAFHLCDALPPCILFMHIPLAVTPSFTIVRFTVAYGLTV
jgi:hypothetical protein